MRILIFFDLPTYTLENKRSYMRFKKFLSKNGFMMMQESLYCKLALNSNAVRLIINNVYKNKPEEGIVQLLSITEKQFSNMEIITGNVKIDVLNNDKRLIII